jgi:hypothetical protein
VTIAGLIVHITDVNLITAIQPVARQSITFCEKSISLGFVQQFDPHQKQDGDEDEPYNKCTRLLCAAAAFLPSP